MRQFTISAAAATVFAALLASVPAQAEQLGGGVGHLRRIARSASFDDAAGPVVEPPDTT